MDGFNMRMVVLLLLGFLFFDSARAQSIAPSIEYYEKRYPLHDVYSKLVDNHGDGFEALYGVRNFRKVLSGVVYRGGGNNAFNKNHRRSNANPLPSEGLRHLCQEGFSTAIYLYEQNYASAPHDVSCQSVFGGRNELSYEQFSPLSGQHGVRDILKIISLRLRSSSDQSPIYLHCWNGWHASGFISAVTLRQFCGWSGRQAVAYWDRNTDGNNGSSGYEKIRQKIRDFTPYPELAIDEETRAKVCPRSLADLDEEGF